MASPPELTTPFDECDADGNLNEAAVGWSRRPLHTCNLDLQSHWSLKRRWDHWWIVGARGAFSVTCADLDYVKLGAVSVFDFETKQVTSHDVTTSQAVSFPVTPAGGPVVLEQPELAIAISEEPAPRRTHIVAHARTNKGPPVQADVLIERPQEHQSLNVLVPMGGRTRFQFTSKQGALPASGSVTVGGTALDLGAASAYLDFGRGVWPRRVRWNWGAGSGPQGGRHVSLQLGAQWTDGTGQTENAVFIDGVMHKLGDDLEFRYDRSDLMKPWTIRPKDAAAQGRLALEFHPILSTKKNLCIARLHLCFGHYRGAVTLESGERVVIDGLLGWAEDFAGLW